MILCINPTASVVKVVNESKTFTDKKTGEKRDVKLLRVNVLDGDGDIGAIRLYDPSVEVLALFVKGKPLPRNLEIVGLDVEAGVNILSVRVV